MTMLQAQRVTKSFGPVHAVQEVTFEVRSGEIYGLLGPNGAGKTTTISMISGLLRPNAGTVMVDGANVWVEPARAKRAMGVVPQEIAIYEDLSARENFEFWGQLAGLTRSDAKSRTAELLKALQLDARAKDSVKTFSGGMKRRVNIGCALLHRPKLLLLDEPTVSIDPQARTTILDFVRKLRSAGTAILYTTHYLEEAESLCDRIGIIDQGRLLAEGTLNELRKRIGGEHLFVIESDFTDTDPGAWDGFNDRFRIIQKSERHLAVSPHGQRDPADVLRELLHLPIKAENVVLKRPTLNDVFLQLTGRDLRE